MISQSELAQRVVWGGLIGFPCLIAIFLGGAWFTAIATVAALALAMEWRLLTCPGSGFSSTGFVSGCVAAPVAMYFAGAPAAFACVGAAIILGALPDVRNKRPAIWNAPGALAAGLAPACLVALRAQPAGGLETVLWLCAVVAVTDTGAYFSGMLVGGPKLAPRVSPAKTWSGAVGGLLLGTIVGMMFVPLLPDAGLIALAMLSLAVSLIGQLGDLAESALKRLKGVKDSSSLIPGHGGALDRFDSLIAASLCLSVFRIFVEVLAPEV